MVVQLLGFYVVLWMCFFLNKVFYFYRVFIWIYRFSIRFYGGLMSVSWVDMGLGLGCSSKPLLARNY